MKKLIALFAVSLLMLAGQPAFAKSSPEETRAEIRQAAQTILKDLYQAKPSARKAVESSAGYAVFSNFGMKMTAAATTGEQRVAYQGAVAVSPGVWLYQLTDKGLAAEVTVKGTKYYKDDNLN